MTFVDIRIAATEQRKQCSHRVASFVTGREPDKMKVDVFIESYRGEMFNEAEDDAQV